MKQCKNCNAVYDDSRIRCLDCDEALERISDYEAGKIKAEQAQTISKLSDKAEDFYVTRLERVLIALEILGLIATIVIFIVNTIKSGATDLTALALVTILFFILGILHTAFPKFFWGIEKFSLGFTIDDAENAIPSGLYLTMYKFSIYITFIIAYLLLIFGLILQISIL